MATYARGGLPSSRRATVSGGRYTYSRGKYVSKSGELTSKSPEEQKAEEEEKKRLEEEKARQEAAKVEPKYTRREEFVRSLMERQGRRAKVEETKEGITISGRGRQTLYARTGETISAPASATLRAGYVPPQQILVTSEEEQKAAVEGYKRRKMLESLFERQGKKIKYTEEGMEIFGGGKRTLLSQYGEIITAPKGVKIRGGFAKPKPKEIILSDIPSQSGITKEYIPLTKEQREERIFETRATEISERQRKYFSLPIFGEIEKISSKITLGTPGIPAKERGLVGRTAQETVSNIFSFPFAIGGTAAMVGEKLGATTKAIKLGYGESVKKEYKFAFGPTKEVYKQPSTYTTAAIFALPGTISAIKSGKGGFGPEFFKVKTETIDIIKEGQPTKVNVLGFQTKGGRARILGSWETGETASTFKEFFIEPIVEVGKMAGKRTTAVGKAIIETEPIKLYGEAFAEAGRGIKEPIIAVGKRSKEILSDITRDVTHTALPPLYEIGRQFRTEFIEPMTEVSRIGTERVKDVFNTILPETITIGAPDIAPRSFIVGEDLKIGSAFETRLVQRGLQKTDIFELSNIERSTGFIDVAQNMMRSTKRTSSAYIRGFPKETSRLTAKGVNIIKDITKQEQGIISGSFSRGAQLAKNYKISGKEYGLIKVPKDIDVHLERSALEIEQITKSASKRLKEAGYTTRLKDINTIEVKQPSGKYEKAVEFLNDKTLVQEEEQVPEYILGIRKVGKRTRIEGIDTTKLNEELRGVIQGAARLRETKGKLDIYPPEKRVKDIGSISVSARTLEQSQLFPRPGLKTSIEKFESFYPEKLVREQVELIPEEKYILDYSIKENKILGLEKTFVSPTRTVSKSTSNILVKSSASISSSFSKSVSSISATPSNSISVSKSVSKSISKSSGVSTSISVSKSTSRSISKSISKSVSSFSSSISKSSVSSFSSSISSSSSYSSFIQTIPPERPPIIIPSFKFGRGITKEKKKKKRLKMLSVYNPSLRASELRIFGAPPKVLTGLETRPVPYSRKGELKI